MENIFTFQEQQKNNVQNSQLNFIQNTSPCLIVHHKPISFNDFQDEDNSQTQQKDKHEKIDKIYNKRSPFTDIQNQQKQFYKLAENQNLKTHVKNQTQNNNNMLAGLEIQDLDTNPMEYVSQKKALKVTDIRKFLNTPLGDYKVRAIVKKEKSNIFNIYTKYHVHIQQNNKYLFSVYRNGLSQYVFSLDKNNASQQKKSYLGKMKTNFSGTQFFVFDNGFSPDQTRSLQNCRKQIASIKYTSTSGPRKFTAIISTNCQGFYALESGQNILLEKWEKKERNFLSILHSKLPELDPDDGNYKLDFKGIVKKASVKNFILGGIQWDDSLIFGKIDDETFVMQIKEPLSVFQASAICISSIHYKFH